MPPILLESLYQIMAFFLTEGAGGGIIGAFAILIASHLGMDVGLPLKTISLGLKVLFVFTGGLLGALFFYTKIAPGMEYCSMIGAGWPYVAVGLKMGGEAFGKGRALRNALKRLGAAAGEALIKMARESGENKEEG